MKPLKVSWYLVVYSPELHTGLPPELFNDDLLHNFSQS